MRSLMCLFILFVSRSVFSAQCDAVFPHAVQSHSNSGVLTINSGAQITNPPSTVLPFVSGVIIANAGTSCGTADCSVSGFAAESLGISGEFPSFSGNSYNSFGATFGEGSVNTNVFGFINAKSGTTRFSNNYAVYYLNGLNIDAGATVDLKPGTYWIKDLNLNSSDTVGDVGINVVGTGTVYLYANNVTVNGNRVINGLTSTAGINLGTYQNINFNSNSQGEGLIYSLGTATFNSGSVFTGVVSAVNVILDSNSTINYVADLFDTYDYGNTCSNQAPASQRAFYQFNETGWNGVGTVIDSSGNDFNATPLGSASPLSYSGGTCRVLDIPANTSSGELDAVDTGIDINDIGDVGSIGFWYRSDLSWSDATKRQLFDASNQVPSADKHFYLSLGNGVLELGIEDEGDNGIFASFSNLSVAANQWVYITATWDVPNSTVRLYLFTNNASAGRGVFNSSFDVALGDYDTLYIGDNRSNYFVNNSTGNSAHGQFEDFEIYNYVLTLTEARTIAGDEPTCGSLDTEIVAHWPMNVCAFDGNSGEVIDVINGANGVAVDGANISEDGLLCQTSEYAGNGQHINISHDNAFELDDGAIAMWFQVYDLQHSNDSSRDALVLFSKDSTGTDNGGDHLTIYVSSNGSINARHQSSSSSFNASSSGSLVTENQWHHLVYTFGSEGMQIYLDKQLVATESYLGGLAGNSEPIVLGSGAWRTGNNVSEPSALRDHFIGKIDDVRLYQGQLQQTEINELFELTEDNCTACPNDDVLEAHWPLDVCSLDGSSNEIIDVINGYNGASAGGASASETGKFCQSGSLNGDGDHFNMPNVNAFEAARGAVSFWFNADDLNHTNVSSQGGQGLFSRDSSGYDAGGHVTIWLQPTGVIRVRHQGTDSNNEINTDSLISADRWHHLVYTWGSSGMRLYIDGVLVGTNVSFTQGTVGNSEPIIFGANAWQSGNAESTPSTLKDFFKGQIDEIKFYSSQIDSSVVTELYEQDAGECASCVVDELVAQYQFEQDEWIGNGAVIDNSNNANNGNHLGNVLPINPSEQIACRALDVPADSSLNGQYNAIDTQVDINTLGNKGSISFHYRSNEAWNSGKPRQLFDASTDLGNNNDSKYFFLTINDTGNLVFFMEDDADKRFGASTSLSLSYPAGEWKHVAVTWDLQSKQIKLFIDGVSQTLTDNSNSTLSSNLGDFDTLYIGDNRSDYLVDSSTQNSADGEFDDVRIYNYVQSDNEVLRDKNAITRCSYVYKYLIDHDGAGLTCEAEPITIRACANESCSALFDENITVNMRPDNGWPDGGSVTINANTPTTLNLSQLTAGTVNLGVLNENTECTGTSSETCNLVFADVGFQFIGASASDAFSDQLAESNFTAAQLRVVKTDVENGIGVCSAAFEGEKTVSFSLSCDDPSVCVTDVQTGGAAISGNGSTDVALTFNSNGIASLADFSYADAGQISLSVEAVIEGTQVGIGSTQFAVVPHQLSVSSSVQNQYARAGDSFSIEIKALGRIGNKALPNYRPGNLQFTTNRSADVAFDGVLTYTQGLTLAATTATDFQDSLISANASNVVLDSGKYSFDAQYNEYGVLSLDLQDTDYFGHTITSAPLSARSPIMLGTFIPAYFEVTPNSPQLASTCSVTTGFTYLGQNTGFTSPAQLVVVAKNANGQTTENYQADSVWTWLSGAQASDIVLSDTGVVGNVGFSNTPTIDVATNEQFGSRTVTIENAQVLYSKSMTPYAAFTSSMDMRFKPSFFTDDSFTGAAICYHDNYAKSAPDDCDTNSDLDDLDDTNNVATISNIDGTEYRWGRLVIENGFGPENSDLLLPVSTQYYTNVGFIKNNDDSCTTHMFNSSNFETQDAQGAPTANIAILNSSFGMISGETLGFEGIKVRNTDQSVMGEYRIELLPVADATVTWDDYLQYDWNGDDAGMGNPSAILSFGQYRGNDRIIHWREVGN